MVSMYASNIWEGIKKQGEHRRASSWGADGAAARVTVHRGCTVGAVGDGAADNGGEAEWENVVLSLPRRME
jgi:hypothetical protein